MPFKDNGSDLSGCNCWNLVRIVLEREAGVSGLKTYDAVSAADVENATATIAAESAMPTWLGIERTEARRFDCVILRGTPLHIGVLLNNSDLLHIWRRTDSVIMPLDHARLRNRIVGFYRHTSLT